MISTKSKKRPRGRPRVGSTPITVRLAPKELSQLDQFIKEFSGSMGRPEAIRELIKSGMQREPPPGWGDDELSKYSDASYVSRWATFHQRKNQYTKISNIDDCFFAFSNGWKDPRGRIEALLLLSSRCLSSRLRQRYGRPVAGSIPPDAILLRIRRLFAPHAHEPRPRCRLGKTVG
jgi:hypothetical protein